MKMYNKKLAINKQQDKSSLMTAEALKSPLFLDLIRQYDDGLDYDPRNPLSVSYDMDGKVLEYHRQKWKELGKPLGVYWKWVNREIKKVSSLELKDSKGAMTFYLFHKFKINNESLEFELSPYGYEFFNYSKNYFTLTNKELQVLGSASANKGYRAKAYWIQRVKEEASKGTLWTPLKIEIDESYEFSDITKNSIRERHFESLSKMFNEMDYSFLWKYKKGKIRVLITQKKQGVKIRRQGALVEEIKSLKWLKTEENLKKEFISFAFHFLSNNESLRKNKDKMFENVKGWHKFITFK